jgi:hypothetical protein
LKAAARRPTIAFVMAVDDATLVRSLRSAGLDLWGAPSGGTGELGLDDLLPALVRSPNAHLRHALVTLLLEAPDAATRFPHLESAWEGHDQLAARCLYTAAVCLQRRWWTTLNIARTRHRLTDLYSAALGLPSPEDDHGRACLLALGERFRALSGLPCDYLTDFDRLVRLYLSRAA